MTRWLRQLWSSRKPWSVVLDVNVGGPATSATVSITVHFWTRRVARILARDLAAGFGRYPVAFRALHGVGGVRVERRRR